MQVDFNMGRNFVWCHKSSVGDANTLPFTTEWWIESKNVNLTSTLNDF